MTMREIQDLTLSRARGSAQLENRFADRAHAFHQWLRAPADGYSKSLGVRVTAMPLTSLYVEKIYGHREVFPHPRNAILQIGANRRIECFVPIYPSRERPILRGAQLFDDSNPLSFCEELLCDGLAEIRVRNRFVDVMDNFLFTEWILGSVVYVLSLVKSYRRSAGVPGCEFALEIELDSSMGNMWITNPWHSYGDRRLGTSFACPWLLPRLSIGPEEEFERLVASTIQDLFNSAGVVLPDGKITMAFS
jgi:hypothetical protein